MHYNLFKKYKNYKQNNSGSSTVPRKDHSGKHGETQTRGAFKGVSSEKKEN